jgi:hypothetical protein
MAGSYLGISILIKNKKNQNQFLGRKFYPGTSPKKKVAPKIEWADF